MACEVKARRAFNLTGWLKQAVSDRRNGVPFVVVRPDGYGPAKINQWGVIMPLADYTKLLHEAGYGSPGEPQPDAVADGDKRDSA